MKQYHFKKTMEHKDFEKLIGLTIDQAQKVVGEEYGFRTTMIDGKHMMVTHDFCPDRINIHIENGLIVKVRGIG